MAKVPSKLKIGHLDVRVKRKPNLRGENDRRLFGSYNAGAQEIKLDADVKPDRELEVLLHEMLHALWDQYDLPADDEERLVGCLGAGLAQVLIDNPKFVDYIKEVGR